MKAHPNADGSCAAGVEGGVASPGKQPHQETPVGEGAAANSSGNAGGLAPTKCHAIESLVAVSLINRETFSLQFRGDHAYFYMSPDAVEIVSLLESRHLRRAAARAIAPNAQTELLRFLEAGEVAFPTEDDIAPYTIQKLDLMQSIRAGALDGYERVAELQKTYELIAGSTAMYDHVRDFRAALTTIRSSFVNQLMTRNRSLASKLRGKAERRKLPKFADEAEATLVTEEALQSLVISKSVFAALWGSVTATFAPEQVKVDETARLLRSQPVSFFGIHEDFEAVKFDWVRTELNHLTRCFTPSSMLTTIFIAVKSIVLCVEAHFKLQAARAAAAACADLDRSGGPAVAGSMVLDQNPLEMEQSTLVESPTYVRRGNSKAAASFSRSAASSSQADASAAAATDGDSAPALRGPSPRKSADYTTDDVLPMLIYIIVCGDVPNLAIARRFVELVGETEATERQYYFTVFCSAVQFLVNFDNRADSTETATSGEFEGSAYSQHSPFSTPRLVRDQFTPSPSSSIPPPVAIGGLTNPPT